MKPTSFHCSSCRAQQENSGCTTRSCLSMQHLVSNTATHTQTATPSPCGKHSLVTSSMVHRLCSTSTWWQQKINGSNKTAWCCCCHMVSKARARSIPVHASNGSCNHAQKTTFKLSMQPRPLSSSMYCVANCIVISESHWLSSHRSNHYE